MAKPCAYCGDTPSRPSVFSGHEHARLCADCTSALHGGAVVIQDTDGDDAIWAALRSQPGVGVFRIGRVAIDLPIVEVAKLGIRTLLSLGAFNRNGDSSIWPSSIPVPTLTPQTTQPRPEPSFTWLHCDLTTHIRCACGEVVELTQESGLREDAGRGGWVQCTCGRGYRPRVEVEEEHR